MRDKNTEQESCRNAKPPSDAARCSWGNTVLLHLFGFYAHGERLDMQKIKTLAEKGADLNVRDEDIADATALILAASNGDLRMMKFLIEHGADIHARGHERHDSALECAADINDDIIALGRLNYLLAHGASVNPPLDDDSTALIYAASHGNEACVNLLISRGADLDREDVLEARAIDAAIEGGHFECVKRLLDAGVDFKHLRESDPDGYAFCTNYTEKERLIRKQHKHATRHRGHEVAL